MDTWESKHPVTLHSSVSNAMPDRKFYEKHPILHQYPKYLFNIQPIQVAYDHIMTIREAIKFQISDAGHTFKIIAVLLPFSSFDFIFGLISLRENEGKRNDAKLEFKFKIRAKNIAPTKVHTFTSW